MALQNHNRIQETTQTSGDVSFLLAGALTGYRPFASGVGDGNICYYVAEHYVQDQWEIGIGTYDLGTDTLSRDTIIDSSDGGNKIGFASGVKSIFVDIPESKRLYYDENDRIGINVDSPTNTLEVNGGTSNIIADFQSTDQYAWAQFTDDEGFARFGVRDGDAVISANEDAVHVVVASGTGYVGINVASPDELLEVGLNSAIFGTYTYGPKLECTSAGGYARAFKQYATNSPTSAFYFGTFGNGSTGITRSFWVHHDSDTDFYTSANGIIVLPDGSVGIGTTTPGYLLEVDGDGYFSDDLTVAGDVVIDGNGTTIGTADLANAWLLVGTTSAGVGFDANEIMFNGTGTTNIGNIHNYGLRFHINGNERLELDANYLDATVTIRPHADSVYDLGTSSLYWDNLYVNNLHASGVNTIGGFTAGSVLFADADGLVSEDNSNLFWDDSSKRLEVKAIKIQSTASEIQWLETDADVDEGLWGILGTVNRFRGVLRSDAGVAGETWLDVFRTGTTVDTVQFPRGTVEVSEDLTVGDDLTVAGELFVDGTGNSYVMGKLGVGYSTPEQKLQSSGTIRVGYSTDSYFVDIGTNNLKFNRAAASYIDQTVVGGSLNFRTSNASSQDTTALVIASDGGATFYDTVDIEDDLTVAGDILPASDSIYDIGTSTVRPANVWVDDLYGRGIALGTTVAPVTLLSITANNYGAIDVLASDQEEILSTRNDSAGGDPNQFFIKHNGSKTIIGNYRNTIQCSGTFEPYEDSTFYLGTSSSRWLTLYVDNITTTDHGDSSEWNSAYTSSHTRLHNMNSASDHSATAYRLFYSDSAGDVQELTHGTSGYVLTSNGASADPSWQAAAATYTDEDAQDAVGGILVNSPEISLTYVDGNPSISGDLIAGSIDETKLDTSVNASLDLADSAIQSADLGTAAYEDVGYFALASHTNSTSDLQGGNWKVVYLNGAGAYTELALGSANQVLTSNGATSAPTWETPASTSGFVPYTGATQELDLGTYSIVAESGIFATAVGINKVVPEEALHVQGDAIFGTTGASYNFITLRGDSSSAYAKVYELGLERINYNPGEYSAAIQFYRGGSTANCDIVFATQNTAGTLAERLRIDSVGDATFAEDVIVEGDVDVESDGKYYFGSDAYIEYDSVEECMNFVVS
jgi:hypothetical protein